MNGACHAAVMLGITGLTFGVFAAKPAANPVASGYPAWRGIVPKNYIYGRTLLSDAELRQRITVVVEFDAAKAAEQIEATAIFAPLNGLQWAFGTGVNWEKVTVPHDVMVIFVARNARDHAEVWKAVTNKDAGKFPNTRWLGINRVPVYEGVTFDGAPSAEGRYPYVYVMGVEGTEPLVKGTFDAGTANRVQQAIAAEKKKIKDAGLVWRPFYGYVTASGTYPELAALIVGEKPLDAVVAKLKKGLLSVDAGVARESQMLYDALEQTRSDMTFLIQCSYLASPHVAAYQLGRLLKYWPKSRKQLSEVAEKIKANAEARQIVRIYPKLVVWSDDGFVCKNAAEAHKIVAELKQMKKSLEPLKGAVRDTTVQNGVEVIELMIDELIIKLPDKVR